MNEKEKGLRYTTTVDLDVAGMYAEERCKHCSGRGILSTQVSSGGTIRKDKAVEHRVDYCSCVRKNVRKYG